MFVCIVFIHSISNWIFCGHLVSFTIYPNKSLFECDTIGKSYVDLKKIWNRIVERRACTKKKQAITPQCCAPIMCNYFNFFFICLFVLVLIWVLHLILVSYICVLMLICELSFFWSQRNNDIGHMISIAIIQLLPKRAAFILFISAPLFALFLSLWVSIVIFDCPLQWFLEIDAILSVLLTFLFSSKLFKHILCAQQIFQLLAILKANTFDLNILWLFGWCVFTCLSLNLLCCLMNEFIKIGISTWI